MPLPIVQVDAFAASPFEGNPAAVAFSTRRATMPGSLP